MIRRRLLPPILLGVMGISLLAGLGLGNKPPADGLPWNSAPPEVQAVLWPEPRPLDGFELTNTAGEPFLPAAFQGQWSFVFFGYLTCPDICPSSLHAMREMSRMLEQRQSTAIKREFIFVSVDPTHDRPDAIQEYLAWFDAGFIGLSGTEPQLQALARPMAVKFEEHIDDDGYRSIDHSSSLMIIDPAGRVVGAIPPPLQPERMVAQFERLHAFVTRRGF
ncbi:MAG: SCO family protein [Wenzhouxiangella sp.]